MKNQIIDYKILNIKVTDKTNWLFIKLIDRNNLLGWGEATLSGKETEIYNIKDKILKNILNKTFDNPYDLKHLLSFKDIVHSSLSSSIMQALWDIYGKTQKKTIGLYFGSKKKHVEIYANFNRATIDRSIEGITLKTKEVLNDKFQFIKFAPFDEINPKMENKEFNVSLSKGLERINTIREISGKKIKVLIDCHWRFNPKTAIELVNQCKNLNLYWIECPIIENHENIENIKSIRSLANKKGIKLAGLEKKILKEGFMSYLKSGVYDVMMPDIKYAGGPDEMLEIEKLFNKYNVEFSPHNPSGPIAHAHSLQVSSATVKNTLMEYQYKETKYFDSLLEIPNPKIFNGLSKVPNSCYGLGVSINEKKLKEFNI